MEQNDYQSPSPMHDGAYDDDRAIDEESSPRHLSHPDPQDSANESVSPHNYEYQTEPDNDDDEQDQCDGQENQGDMSPHQMYPPPIEQPGSSVPMPYYPSPNRTNSPKALQPASPLHNINEYSFLRGLLFGKARRVNIPNHPFSNGHFCELTCILHCTFDGSFEDGLFKTDSANEFCAYSRKRFSGYVYEGYFEGHFSGEVRVDEDDTLCLTGWFAGYLDGKFVDKLNNESNNAINSNSDFLTCHEPSTVYLLPHPSLTISAYSSVSILASGRLWIDQFDISTDIILPDIALKRDNCKFEINCEIESINGNTVDNSRNLEFRGTVYGSFDGIFSGSVSKHYKNGREICSISGSFGGMLINCRFEGIFTDSIDQTSSGTISITQANDQLSTFYNPFSHQANDQPSGDLLEDNPSETSLPCDSPAVAATASSSTAVNHQASQCNLVRPAESSATSGDHANDTNCTAPSTQSDDQPSGDLLEDNPSGTSFARESSASTVTAAATAVNDQASQSNLLRPAESSAASGNEANVVNCPDQPTKGDEKPRRRSARFSGKASKCTSNDIKEEEDDDEEEEASSPPVKKTRVKPSHSHTVEQPGTSGQQQQQPAIQDPIDETSSPPNKCVTTVSLKCLEPTCGIMVVEKEFNSHLKGHSIGPYRCVFNLHCGESFHSPYKLTLHYHEAHRRTLNWKCDECSKGYCCSESLYRHYHDYHRLGTFACSFPGCTTVGETYIDVYKHYTRTHKEVKCPDCNFKTHYESRLKKHQQGHHCNWSIRMAKMEFDCSNSK